RTKMGPDTDSGKLGTYWCACMDSSGAAGPGETALRGLIEKLGGLNAPADLAARVAAFHDNGIGVMFQFRSAQDPRNSDLQIANVGQGGINLPDRDYYVRGDSAGVA